MDSAPFIKAVKTPPSRGKARDAWIDFKVWWQIHVWGPFAPRWLSNLWWDWTHFYYNQISSRIWPRNRWAEKVIPRTWADKPELIREFLFATVRHLVSEDGEDCFNTVEWDENHAVKLREIAEWAKSGRDVARNHMDSLWSPPEISTENGAPFFIEGSERGDLNAYIAAERAIEDRDTEYLVWIVSNRAILWT